MLTSLPLGPVYHYGVTAPGSATGAFNFIFETISLAWKPGCQVVRTLWSNVSNVAWVLVLVCRSWNGTETQLAVKVSGSRRCRPYSPTAHSTRVGLQELGRNRNVVGCKSVRFRAMLPLQPLMHTVIVSLCKELWNVVNRVRLAVTRPGRCRPGIRAVRKLEVSQALGLERGVLATICCPLQVTVLVRSASKQCTMQIVFSLMTYYSYIISAVLQLNEPLQWEFTKSLLKISLQSLMAS